MLRRLLLLTSFLLVFGLVAPNIALSETVETTIDGDNNDNEEDLNPSKLGETDLDSSDLEFPYEDTGQVDPQLVGLRFQVDVPAGKYIWNAWVRFQVDETKTPDTTLPVNVIIEGELSPDAPEFVPEGAGTFDISSRPVTTAKAYWSVPDWDNVGDEGDAQTTVNLAEVIQEIIDQPGWASGNSLILIIRDDPNNPSQGMRCAEDGDSADQAALLHIEYEDYPLNPEAAYNPTPGHKEMDVLRDSTLNWIPTSAVNTVYLGTDANAVDAATETSHDGVTVFTGLDNTVDPGRLEFGTTYYWRVDGDSKGNLWNFTVETLSYVVPTADVNAVASSSAPNTDPANAANGAGLTDGLHSTDDTTMWVSANVDTTAPEYQDENGAFDPALVPPAYIQFDFTRAQLLQKIKVWNYNAMSEAFVGWSMKDVIVETSMDGENWDAIESITSFNRGPGTPDIAATDVFELSTPIPATSVRITALSNYGGILMQYGISEVEFYAIPTYAADLDPADGDTIDMADMPQLTWRPGRNVDQHSILLSTDPNALAEVTTTSEASIGASELGLIVGETYYWQIDEVNESDSPSIYAGSMQSFSVLPYITVDNFDQYGNLSPKRPFQTWTDGFGYSSDEHFPNGYGGNGTGAAIGHDVWSLSSPYYNGDIMESDITIPGSAKSMPFYYTGASETTRTFAEAQDWTQAGVTTLSIWFYGDSGNTASPMYAKINSLKVPYNGNTGDVAMTGWQVWNIDLASLNTNLESVTSLTIGIEGASASGVLFLDDIALQPAPIAPLTEWRVSASTDDAEEHVLDSGVMEGLGSSDLELGYEASEGGIVPEAQQTIGCRWTGIAIPAGATITEAWVQFSADDVDNDYHQGAVSLVITGEAPGNALTFTENLYDISNRTATTASVVWDVPVWTETQLMGPGERTPDISNVIQEIVSDGAWAGTVVLMFADNPANPSQGCREAESYDGTSSEAPLLHIVYE